MTDMNLSLISFQFEAHSIRTVTDEHGNPWFVAADVCTALSLDQVTRAIDRLDDDEKQVIDFSALTTNKGVGNQELNVINESGLYSLVLTSRKPEAKAFKRWITHEVLPAIRKTGSYQIEEISPAELILRQAQFMVQIEHEQKRQSAALKQIEERQRIAEGKIEDFANGAEHFSITAYNKLFRKQQISNSQANTDGRKLTKIAKDNGFELGRAPHPVWGSVHTYPKAQLDAFYRGDYH